jgi:uncharacterized membrane protein
MAESVPSLQRERERTLGLERLVFFSDAVFAISITLLALDLRLPDVPGGYTTDAALLEALRELEPALFAFLLSFVVTAAFWLGHFRTFRLLERTDGRLIALNFAFLCWVALLPFPTSIVASEGGLPAGALIYGLFAVLGGLLSSLLWIYPSRMAHLVSPLVTPELARRIAIRSLVVPAVFAVSLPFALVDPMLAELIWVLAPVAQALVSRRFGLGVALERSLGSFEPVTADEAGPTSQVPDA